MDDRNRSVSCTLPRHRGFTVIELLVVILIIGLLIGLLLPAVQSSRAASRWLECVNHLKQIGIALQNYQSSNGVFPGIAALTYYGQGDETSLYPNDHIYSPLARMLGELDLPVLYNATNFTFDPLTSLSMSANSTVMKTSVSFFLCPADPSPSPEGYGRNNYRFNLGPTPWLGWCCPINALAASGPFSAHNFYRPADFLDGLSNTIGVSERIRGDWTEGVWSIGDYHVIDQPYGNDLTASMAISYCQKLGPSSLIETRSGETWFISGFHTTSYNHCMTPNTKQFECSLDNPASINQFRTRVYAVGPFTARSYHPGGVNCLTMDGSVHFVRDGVALNIWRSLSTRAMGEVIDDSF